MLELEVGDRIWEGQRLTAYEGYMGETYAREQGVEPGTYWKYKAYVFYCSGYLQYDS